jgi:LuxR family quorum-sensing system transcriptional regulator CciR
VISRRLADRFRVAARKCRSLEALRSLLEDAAHDLGFDFFALLHHASLRPRSGDMVRIDNYPADWVDEFLARGFAANDPVHLACRRTHEAFAWSGLGRIIRLEPKQRLILKRSRRFGIGPGFTVPVNIPGEPSGSCSFAVRAGARLPEERLTSAQLIGTHAFDAARRLSGRAARRSPPRLSRREVECLRLLSAGKTDWEISVILEISVETARQYVKRARAAYDAVNRTHLAVLALRDDVLGFEDIPIR